MIPAQKLTLLTIEDDLVVRKGLVTYLEGLGYAVEQAGNGIEGIELFKKVLPDLVITDLRLPGLDGLKVLEEIRNISPSTPVIVFSGMGTLNDAIEALRLGAVDYITKPVTDLELIKHTIDRTLERVRLLRENEQYQEYLEKEVERKTAELHQAQKLEAIGTLAGGIAHDFNNILAVIMGHAELAALSVPPKSELADDIEQILSASDRAKSLVQQILNFGRKKSIKRSPLNTAVIIKETVKMLRATIPVTVQLDFHSLIEKPLVLMDPVELHQIITNMCTNALHALPEERGNITIRIEECDLIDSASDAVGLLTPGKYLELSIQDDGDGIEPDHLSTIFEPFFTTKEQDEGTGLGLSVVREIVSQCDGEIQVESQHGKGTVFKMFFPLIEDTKEDRDMETVDLLPVGNEKILFIDDEVALVETMERMLTFLGYKPICCTSAEDALEILAVHNGNFDLIISDQSMPNIPGNVLVEKIGVSYPEIPIILCTGYSSVVDRQRAFGLGVSDFVMKPISIHELANKVRTVLDCK